MSDSTPTELRSLAVVLPRYGAELGGGAETLIRDLICETFARNYHRDQLPILSGISRIEIWTTCAKDHRTWENFYPAGITEDDGFPVQRFPVDERDLETFIGREIDIASGRLLHPDEQLDWLQSGVNSKKLYAHIAAQAKTFDAILFGPYLFPTTFWGGLIAPEKTLLLPCLHNERYAYQDVFSVLFRSARGIVCNAAAEATLIAEIYGESVFEKTAVVGKGFEIPPEPKPREKGRYLLYSGRKEEGKNLHRLIEWFAPIHRSFPDVELLLIGSGEIQFLKEMPTGVRDLGFVSAEEKHELMGRAIALCQPSVNESFSIVLMEAWLEKTPVLVHGECPVTRDHAVTSQGGLYFSNRLEFIAVVEKLLREPSLVGELGQNGYEYVQREYSWPAVLNRFEMALAKFNYRPFQNPSDTSPAPFQTSYA